MSLSNQVMFFLSSGLMPWSIMNSSSMCQAKRTSKRIKFKFTCCKGRKNSFKRRIWNFWRCTINIDLEKIFSFDIVGRRIIIFHTSKQRLTSILFMNSQIKMAEQTRRSNQQNNFYDFFPPWMIGSFDI